MNVRLPDSLISIQNCLTCRENGQGSHKWWKGKNLEGVACVI
jgi:hypothetical protein